MTTTTPTTKGKHEAQERKERFTTSSDIELKRIYKPDDMPSDYAQRNR